MNTLSKLFGKSPFKLLKKHMVKASECSEKIKPLFDALKQNDYKTIRSISHEIMKIEHEADKIKNRIRNELPKSLFLSVDRKDLLNLLSAQDSIADNIEDLGVLVTLKELEVPDQIVTLLDDFVNQIVLIVSEALNIIATIDDLLEASFEGPEADNVLELINKIDKMEWESDKIQCKLAKEILKLEDEIGAVSIMMWMKIFEKMADIADSAEKISKMLRLFLAA